MKVKVTYINNNTVYSSSFRLSNGWGNLWNDLQNNSIFDYYTIVKIEQIFEPESYNVFNNLENE